MKKLVYLFFIFLSLPSFAQTFTSTASLGSPRVQHESQMLFNGNVLVFGGDNGGYLPGTLTVYKSSELYNPQTETWTTSGSMYEIRTDFASAVLNDGKIIAIGGQEGSNENIKKSCEVYNPATGNWTYSGDMNQPRYAHKGIKLNDGRVLVAGGLPTNKTSEIFDPVTNTWSFAGNLSVARDNGMSLVLLSDGRVLATGGSNATSRTAEIFDPVFNTWTLISNSMNVDRMNHNTILLADGKVLIYGSTTSGNENTSEVFDPSTNNFSVRSNMNLGRAGNPGVLMDNGKVFVFGRGNPFTPAKTNLMEVYDPVGNSWISFNYTQIGNSLYTIHKLGNGRILIVGGSHTDVASSDCYLVTQDDYTSCQIANRNLTITGDLLCIGQEASVAIQGTEAGVSYQAQLANGIKVGASYSGGGDITLNFPTDNLVSDTYVVNVVVQKSGCPEVLMSDTATVKVESKNSSSPIITVNGSVDFCSGSSVELIAPAGFANYKWSDGSTTSSIVVNNTGSYFVKVMDQDGCLSKSSIVVKTTKFSTVTAGASESTCENNPAFQLTGFSPIGGIWSGQGVDANGKFDPSSVIPGTYTLSYANCSQTKNKTITVAGLPKVKDFNIDIPADTVCQSGLSFIVVKNSESGTIYQLMKNGSYIGSMITGLGTDMNLPTGALSTTTTFSVVGRRTNSCGTTEVAKPAKVVVMPDINSATQTIMVTDTVCFDMRPKIKIVNSDPQYRYKLNAWGTYYQGNGDTLTLEGDKFVYNYFNDNSRVTYQVLVTNSIGCTPVSIFNKELRAIKLEANFSTATNYLLDEQISISNLSNGTTYKWNLDGSSSISSSTSKDLPPIQYSTTGIKSIELISYSKFGCIDTLQRTFEVYKQASQSPLSNCYLDTIHSQNLSIGEQQYKGLFNILAHHVDQFNNTYIAGVRWIEGGRVGGSFAYYLQKIGATGNLIWEKTQDPYSYDVQQFASSYITAITSDLKGNIYLTGSYGSNEFKIDNLSSKKYGNLVTNPFVVKLNPDGVAQWMIEGVDNNFEVRGATDIIYKDDDHIYVSIFGTTRVKFNNIPDQFFNYDINVVQINKNGDYIKSFSSSNSDIYHIIADVYCSNCSNFEYGMFTSISPKIKMAPNGKVILAAKLLTLVKIDNAELIAENNKPTNFIAVLDTAIGWERAFITHTTVTEGDRLQYNLTPQFTIDNNNDIYITDYYIRYGWGNTTYIKLADNTVLGDTTGSVIMKYDMFGNLKWYNHNAVCYPRAIEYVSATNEIITYGNTWKNYFSQGSQSQSAIGLKTKGESDAFLSSTSPDGNTNWIQLIGSKGKDNAHSMALNSCNEISIVGDFDFKGGINSDSLSYSEGKMYLARISPLGSCSSICGVEIEVPTGINSSYSENSVSVYPNPSNGIINIAGLSQRGEVVVTNTLGEVVYTKQFSDLSTGLPVDLSSLSEGAYNITVSSNDKIYHELIIIHH